MNDYAPLLERAFDIDRQEGTCRLDAITGEVPNDIRGTYYMNGPARFTVGDVRYRSWLDGDGMVCALQFGRDGIHFTNRYVRNTKFIAEAQEGKAIYRQFGTAFEGDQLRRGIATETPSNISVYPFGDTLLACGEYAVPWALDPVTLETIGPFTFHGQLNDISPFSPHPKVDAASGDLYNFGVSFSATRPRLYVYRFDRDAKPIFRQRLSIDYPCSVHDCSLSGSYAIFHLNPYILDIEKLMGGDVATIDAMTWEPERGSTLRIVSRDTGEGVASIPIGQRYCQHMGNSYEADNQLIIDLVEYDRPLFDQYEVVPELFTNVSAGRPVRFVVDMESWTVVEQRELDYTSAPDFLQFNRCEATKPSDHMWMLGIAASGKPGRKFFDQLVHVDWRHTTVDDVYSLPRHQYFGAEPVLAYGSGDEVAVICHVFDAEQVRSYFAIFDAHQVSAGPVATIGLPYPIHLGFHATFDPRYI